MDKPAEFYRKALREFHNMKQGNEPITLELFAKRFERDDEEENVLALCRMMDAMAELFTTIVEPSRLIMRDAVIDAILKIAYHNHNILTQKGER